MPKVNKVKANKDHPKFGIVKGQEHYHWVLKTGPRSSREFRQTTPPKRSQLTASDFLGQLYGIFDDEIANAQTPDDLTTAAENLRALGQEQQEKYDNMPEGLQQGDTGQMVEGRASGCESAADEIDNIASTWESTLTDDELSEEDEAAYDALVAAHTAHAETEPDEDDFDDDSVYAEAYQAWENSEPDEPEDKDFDDLRNTAREEAISSAQDQESECNP